MAFPVTSERALEVTITHSVADRATLLNRGDTLYYSSQPNVSASSHEGQLTDNQSIVISAPTFLISAGHSLVSLFDMNNSVSKAELEEINAVVSTTIGALGEEGKALSATDPRITPLDLVPENYGAKANGTTDDTEAFQKCAKAIKAAHGGGTMRLYGAKYMVDGYEWESYVYHEGRNPEKTVLIAKSGSTNPGQIMIPKGPVSYGGWKNMTFQAVTANTEQDCFYLYAQEDEEHGEGGVSWCQFEDLQIGTFAAPFQRNGMWWRGGATGAKRPHQFNTFRNVKINRANTGNQKETSRALKLTGQNAKFEFDTACDIQGTSSSGQFGVNVEIGREFLLATTLTAEAAAGQKVIKVAELPTECESGKVLSVGEANANEALEVSSVSGKEITFKTNLAFAHASGSRVYALSGTIASPATKDSHSIAFHGGAFQNADLQVLVDSAKVIDFYSPDFENQYRGIRARGTSYEVHVRNLVTGAYTEGTSNGEGEVESGSKTLSGATKTWTVGDKVHGPGIEPGTTIEAEVEAGKYTLSLAAGFTGIEGKGKIPLIKGGEGNGYIAKYEGTATGSISGTYEGFSDNYVVSKTIEGGLDSRGLHPLSGLRYVVSNGNTLTGAAKEEILTYNVREFVFTSKSAAVKKIKGIQGTGELLILRNGFTEAIELAKGGNIGLPGKVAVKLEPGEAKGVLRTDYGEYTWVLVG